MGDFVISVEQHDAIVQKAFLQRGFDEEESKQASRLATMASWHGIKTHNAIKALHLDDRFGSRAEHPGCVPKAQVEVLNKGRFGAVQRWNANKKLGQSVAFAAMEECMRMADTHGVGIVTVDNCFHYLWGGGYVIEAAKRGYIAYTNCTSTLAEVVPHGGVTATLGTNPHSWGFPTTDQVGFPIVVDWATSTVAMGRVQQLAREGATLPPGLALDAQGNDTTDPSLVAALRPFGAHKGFGLGLIDELYAAYSGGSCPTFRGRPEGAPSGEKTSSTFFFQCIHPDALDCGGFALGRSQGSNVDKVLRDVMGHGNAAAGAILPGELESRAAKASEAAGGIILSQAEAEEFRKIALEAGAPCDLRPIVR